jgi:hypothetical protein
MGRAVSPAGLEPIGETSIRHRFEAIQSERRSRYIATQTFESATIELGASIGHLGPEGAAPLDFTGMEFFLGPVSNAVFPTGISQVGGGQGGTSPRDLAQSGDVFTLRVSSTGNLYEGIMTWWGAVDSNFNPIFQAGTEPLPGNPNFASAAFEIQAVPEPGTALLMGLGLLGLSVRNRREI